ncbi:MAG TPA: fatty acid hydroxylase family protein [Sulfurovum sp.]|nr:fatty acid hydroxylase family protein [Sulfurovum sp.]
MFDYLTFDYFFDVNQRIYYGYVMMAFFIAFVFFRKSLKKQFSREVLWHKSARLDYLYFIVSGVLKVAIILPLLIGVNEVTLWVVLRLNEYFGYISRIRVSKEILLLSYTLVLFAVSDLSRYWLHRLMHSVPILWRFHRVHHSAEVLNPLTFYRVHPLENILFGLRYVLVTGVITAIYIYFFGAGIRAVEFLGANILVFVFSMIGSNLRHSHIPLSYGVKLEKWFISPLQHQLHHTKIYTHRNFGSYLAIWDRWFGTLTLGKAKSSKILDFGLPIKERERVTHSLLGAFLNPFIKGIKL